MNTNNIHANTNNNSTSINPFTNIIKNYNDNTYNSTNSNNSNSNNNQYNENNRLISMNTVSN